MIQFHQFSFTQGATAPAQTHQLVFSGVGRVYLSCNGRLATSIAGLSSSGPVDFEYFAGGPITLDLKDPTDIYAGNPANPGGNVSCLVISGDFGEGLVP
jgi:hypothetical protein